MIYTTRPAVSLVGLVAITLLAGLSCRQGSPSPAVTGAGVSYPEYVMAGSAEVQEAYRYAMERPEVLQRVPCYCGCSAKGHRHSRDCFVRSEGSGGEVAFEPMGAS
ncbi:MAG: hypothetical protein HYX82_02920 [Chloroflexi bacterium]|nr:hypothetical protein [Chloroflexota bacterium]